MDGGGVSHHTIVRDLYLMGLVFEVVAFGVLLYDVYRMVVEQDRLRRGVTVNQLNALEGRIRRSTTTALAFVLGGVCGSIASLMSLR